MCGRKTLFSSSQTIKKQFNIDKWEHEKEYNPSFNIAPTLESLVIVYKKQPIIKQMRWGFGFVKGSHLRNSHKIDHAYCESNIKWVEVSHGSAVFFDPRIVHSADALTHSKVMVVLTYDLESKQVEQVYDYTFEDRGQGVGPNSLLWKKLQKHNLTPKFIIERET